MLKQLLSLFPPNTHPLILAMLVAGVIGGWVMFMQYRQTYH